MVRINTLFTMLRWFFTPVKLYGGDGGDDSSDSGSSFGDSMADEMSDYGFDEEYGFADNESSGSSMFDRQYAQDMYEMQVASITGFSAEEMKNFGAGFSGNIGVGIGGEVGYTEQYQEMQQLEREMAFAEAQFTQRDMQLAMSSSVNSAFSSLGSMTDFDREFEATMSAMDAFSSMDNVSYYSEFGTLGMANSSWSVESTSSGFFGSTVGIGGGYTSAGSSFSYDFSDSFLGSTNYEQLDMYDTGYQFTSISDNIFGTTTETTSTFQNEDLGWSVSQAVENSLFDITKTFAGVTKPNANLVNAKTYSGFSIFGMDSINWDTHYESAHNQELSFLGEFALDIGEMIAGGKYYNAPQSLVDHAYNIDKATDMLGNITPFFRFAGLASIASLPMLNKNASLSTIENTFGYNTPYQGFAGFSATGSMLSLASGIATGDVMSGIKTIDSADSLLSVVSPVNTTYSNSFTSATPLSAPSLQPTSKYASLALLGSDAGRADYAWDAMNSFRVDFTSSDTVQDAVGLNTLTKE